MAPTHDSGHAGRSGAGHPTRTGRKKLPAGRCRSASQSCDTCSLTFSGVDGTALNTYCAGPNGEDNINFKLCATTTRSAALRCQSSIYNCSIRNLLKNSGQPWFRRVRALEAAEKLNLSCCFEGARLQPCRNPCRMNMALAPEECFLSVFAIPS